MKARQGGWTENSECSFAGGNGGEDCHKVCAGELKESVKNRSVKVGKSDISVSVSTHVKKIEDRRNNRSSSFRSKTNKPDQEITTPPAQHISEGNRLTIRQYRESAQSPQRSRCTTRVIEHLDPSPERTNELTRDRAGKSPK